MSEWVNGDLLSSTTLNARGASATTSAGFSTNTLTPESGGTLSISGDVSIAADGELSLTTSSTIRWVGSTTSRTLTDAGGDLRFGDAGGVVTLLLPEAQDPTIGSTGGGRITTIQSPLVNIPSTLSVDQVQLDAGAYGAPALSFLSNTSAGFIYNNGFVRWIDQLNNELLILGTVTGGGISLGAGNGSISLSGKVESGASITLPDLHATSYTSTVRAYLSDGSALGPSLTFSSSSSAGLAHDNGLISVYNNNQQIAVFGNGAITSLVTQEFQQGLECVGVLRARSGISMVNSTGTLQVGNGTAAGPRLVVGDDPDAGFFYNAGSNQLCSAVSGAQAWSVLSTNGGVAFTAGTPTSSINEMDVLCATAGTAKIGLGSTVGSGTSTAIIAQNTSTDAFTIQLRKLPSLLSTLFQLTHPSAGSGTGLYVLDVSNPAFDPIEVEIMPNDTGGTGYRALVVANS